jgi:cytochrome c553
MCSAAVRFAILFGGVPLCLGQSTEKADFFESKVRPILLGRCSSCHGGQVQMGQKQFTTREGMHRSGVVAPGDPEASALIQAVRYAGKVKMPPPGKLPEPEIAALEKWVRDGAVWPESTAISNSAATGHWALQPVAKAPLPAVKEAAWPRGSIDRFILAKLEERKLTPAAAADRHALLRRVTLDLTGLLPTPQEVAGFIGDPAPNAFEAVVDRLLGSPAFGERWGRHWLDVTYWADTTGVGRRIPLKEAWRYRDYVIRSFATDKPYDLFVREQIAGPPGRRPKEGESQEEALAATGFLVLGPWAWFAYDKAQMRLDVVDLQVDLIGRTILGLTLGCARCHDHKFDPVTNQDYYALAGIFLSTKTTSRANAEGGINAVRLPETTAAARAHADALAEWEKRVERVEADDKVFRKEQEAVRKRIDELKAKPTSEETGAAIKAAEKELAELKKKTEFAADRQILLFAKYMKPRWPEIYAAEEMEFPENARIASRGDAHQLGEFVPRGFLSAVNTGQPPPEIDPHSSGRQELAEWLTSPGHPLTARVYVNRIWHHLFGRGIVATPDNFGTRGEPPTHPELLDYLAARLVENGWSTKQMIREIVLSRVYQLSSRPDPRNEEADAANLWLWRANRRRLEVEAIRDTVLQLSGRLDTARGGPSLPLTAQNVHTIAPYFLEDDSRIEPHIQYRRTVYQPIMRNSQMEDVDILNLFDFKDPDQIVGTRPATTVPTQMLYLMNSAFLKEEAKRFASATRGLDDRARVSSIIMAALNRPATQRDLDQAGQFLSDFKAGAKQQSAPSDAEQEAWARYCHAILVSSEFLYRR